MRFLPLLLLIACTACKSTQQEADTRNCLLYGIHCADGYDPSREVQAHVKGGEGGGD